MLTLLLVLPFLSGDATALFAPPVPLAGPAAVPVGKLLYPTPVLQDVDGDGQVELVLGDLPGNLWVCERLADQGVMAWSEPVHLRGRDVDLKFHNW